MNIIRLGSYNVLNLYDAIDDPGKRDEKTQPKPENEIAAVASVLRDANADVVALQEVEKAETLEQLRGGHLADVYPHSVLIEGNDERGSDVAILSKYPIKNATTHRDHTFTRQDTGEAMNFRRDLLRADIELPNGPPLRVYAVHFKSKFGGEESDKVRTAEASEAARLVREQSADFPGQNVVLIGDANDTPDSTTGQAMITEVGGWGLKDAMATVGKSDHASYSSRPDQVEKWGAKRIDYIMTSPDMNDRLIDAGLVQHEQAAVGSDHYMMTADYRLN
jgi:endonuclease/exonuclease/phosphatase family metal-dependent hydrolase